MADVLVSREEFNGLGKKIETINEHRIQCKTKTETDLKYISQEQKEIKQDLNEIKSNVSTISEKVSQLAVKISIAIAIIVAIFNFLAPVILNKIGL